MLLVRPLPTGATPGTYALVSGNDSNGFPFDSETHPDAPSQRTMSRIVGVYGIAADSYANFGTLKARAEAILWQGLSTSFGAFGTAQWQDELTVDALVGGGPPTGTAYVTIRLDGTFSALHQDATPSSDDAGYVHLVVDVNPTQHGPPEQVAIDLLVHNTGPAVLTGQDGDLYNGSFQFTYGTPFTLRAGLTAYAKTDQGISLAHSVADFSHTAELQIITLPQDATMSAASGTTYPTATAGSSTSTTSPATSSTTTFTVPGSTTTTTSPATGCASRTGFALARCQIDADLASGLCGKAPIDGKLDHALRRALMRVRGFVDAAESGSPRKRRRSLAGGAQALRSLPRKVAKAFHRHAIDAACRQQLDETIGALQGTLAGL